MLEKQKELATNNVLPLKPLDPRWRLLIMRCREALMLIAAGLKEILDMK